MGVTGLWQLISSTGKPVPLESLEGKVLAVDVSVWLHQLSKGMRDGAGNPVANAHLHGLFTRICKLLHCRIKPVFVFDGGVPALKKQTLANRKSRREDAEKSSELMQQKILTNLIRGQILQTAAGDAAGPIGPYYNKPKPRSDKDALFELPPIPETAKRYLNENLHHEEAFIERRELQALIEEEYEDVNQINVESEDFKSLPPEIQHEIIYDIQQNRKNYNMSKIAELPEDSNDFSSYQMTKLLKHSKLHSRLEEVRREINNRQTQDLSKHYTAGLYGAYVQSQRLVSDETSHDSNDFSSYQMSKLLKHSKLHSRLEEVRKEINNRQTQDLSKHYTASLYGADVQSQRLVSDETSHVLLIKGLKNKQRDTEEEMEKKRKREDEKRRKNMKLLERVFPGMSEDSSYTDELLQDSENEGIKQLDFLTVDQGSLSEKIVTQTSQKTDEMNCVDGAILDKSKLGDKIMTKTSGKTDREKSVDFTDTCKSKLGDKPRYKPIIESDSSDDDEMVVQNVTKYSRETPGLGDQSVAKYSRESPSQGDPISIDDDDSLGSEDRDIQMAIALSLQQHNNDDKTSQTKENDTQGNNKTVEKARKLFLADGNHSGEISSSDNELEIIEKVNKPLSETSSSQAIPSVSCKQSDQPHPPKSNKTMSKNRNTKPYSKRRLKASKHESKQLRGVMSRSGASIFKRRMSNLSNEDQDETVPRKVIRTDSDKSDSRDRLDVCTSDHSSRSESEQSQDKDRTKGLGSDGSSDSDDEFIEVKIDPKNIKEDDLFPSSMFYNIVEEGVNKVEVDESSSEESDTSSVVAISEPDTETGPSHDVDGAVSADKEDSDVKTSRNYSSIDESDEDDDIQMDEIKDKMQIRNKSTLKEGPDEQHCDKQTDKQTDVSTVMMKKVSEDSEDEKEDLTTIQEKVEADMDVDEELSQTSELSHESEVSMEASDNKSSQKSEVSVGISDDDQGMRDNLGSPRPAEKDLVREFKAMDELNIRGLRDSLAKEGKKLLQERGKQERLAMSITDQMHAEAQELLQLFGIPYIVSPTEAEAQCAQLDYSKQTQGTITDDSDIWLFGGTCVYKNFFNQQKYVECFKYESIESKLGLSRRSLINIALLCGSDYTDGIQGVGPVTAMEILAEFPGQDGLSDFRNWWEKAQTDMRVNNQKKFRQKLRDLELKEGFPQANVIDAYLHPTVDDSKEKFTWSNPDLQQLTQFALDKLGWTRAKVEETLQPVLKRINDRQNQMRISAYFQPEIYMQPAKVKSKRLQNVVDKFLGVEKDTTDEESSKTEKVKKGKGKSKPTKVDNNDNEDNIELHEETSDGNKINDEIDIAAKPEAVVKSNKGKQPARRGRKGKTIETSENKDNDKQIGKGEGLQEEISSANHAKTNKRQKSNNKSNPVKKSKRLKTSETNENEDADNQIDKGKDTNDNSKPGRRGKREKTKVHEMGENENKDEDSKIDLDEDLDKGIYLAKQAKNRRLKDNDDKSKTNDTDENNHNSHQYHQSLIDHTAEVTPIAHTSTSNYAPPAQTSTRHYASKSFSKMAPQAETSTSFDISDSSSEGSQDSDSDSSDSDIVEAGLDVSEILGLHMGSTDHLLDEPATDRSSVRQKVFATGLNVNEILNLESGDPELNEAVPVDAEPIGASLDDDNMLERWDTHIKSTNDENIDKDILQTSSKVISKEVHVDFANEGGFLREDSNDSFVNDANVVEKTDPEVCDEHVQESDENVTSRGKNNENNEVPCVNRRTSRRQSKTMKLYNTRDIPLENVSHVEKTQKPKKEKSETKKSSVPKRQTRHSKRIDSKEDRFKDKEIENDDNSKVNNKQDKQEVRLDKIKEEPIEPCDENLGEKTTAQYINNPIKRLVTGVPWENRGTKRGRTSRSQGKAKNIKVEPKENLQKKKGNVKGTRKPIGVVNLSESSSDSD